MEQSQLHLDVEITAFPDLRQSSKGGSSAVNASNDIKFGETLATVSEAEVLSPPAMQTVVLAPMCHHITPPPAETAEEPGT